jgi:hypothetical protein
MDEKGQEERIKNAVPVVMDCTYAVQCCLGRQGLESEHG